MDAKSKKCRNGNYSDLAAERRHANPDCEGVEFTKEDCDAGIWERVRITFTPI